MPNSYLTFAHSTRLSVAANNSRLQVMSKFQLASNPKHVYDCARARKHRLEPCTYFVRGSAATPGCGPAMIMGQEREERAGDE